MPVMSLVVPRVPCWGACVQMNVMMQTIALIDKRLGRSERQLADLRALVVSQHGETARQTSQAGDADAADDLST